MKLVHSLLLLSLTVTLGIPASAAARSAATSRTKPIPVVATYFSNYAPRVGQHETVTTQFYLYQPKKKPHYLSGGHLSIAVKIGTLKVGKTLLATLKGTTTNKQGKAFAHFTVPKQARGKVIWVYTTITYRGTRNMGNNRVVVAK